jgi:hypothetical protein
LTTEVVALCQQVAALTARLAGTLPGPALQEPSAEKDAPD